MRFSDESTNPAAPAPIGCSIGSHMLALGASAVATTATPPGLAFTCSIPDMNASVPALVEVVWSVANAELGMPTLTRMVPERSFSRYGAVVDASANLVTFAGAIGTDSSALLDTLDAAVSTSSSKLMTAFSLTPAAWNEPHALA